MVAASVILARMSFSVPFAGVDRRTACLRATLLIACLLGMISSAPVWFNARSFPLVPVAPWFPILPAPADKIFFGLMLAALVAAAWFYRQAVIGFLILALFAFCEDQNRGQLWFYMYWVMLLLSVFPAPASLGLPIALSVVYLWSDSEVKPHIFNTVPDWFIAGTIGTCQRSRSNPALDDRGGSVWGSRHRHRFVAATAAEAGDRHCRDSALMTLLILGPAGHNYNWVVWPWNLAMVALVRAVHPR